MSIHEFEVWRAYRRKYGPMNDVRRYDRPAAMVVSALSRGKVKAEDLMPFGKAKPEQSSVSLDDIVAAWGPGVKIGKRR